MPLPVSQLYSIPQAELLPDPNQPRKFLDPVALAELAASIAQHGVLEPILFRVDSGEENGPGKVLEKGPETRQKISVK